MPWDKNELQLILWRAISVLFPFDRARKQPRGTDCLHDYFLWRWFPDFRVYCRSVLNKIWFALCPISFCSGNCSGRHFIGTIHNAEALKHHIICFKNYAAGSLETKRISWTNNGSFRLPVWDQLEQHVWLVLFLYSVFWLAQTMIPH